MEMLFHRRRHETEVPMVGDVPSIAGPVGEPKVARLRARLLALLHPQAASSGVAATPGGFRSGHRCRRIASVDANRSRHNDEIRPRDLGRDTH